MFGSRVDIFRFGQTARDILVGVFIKGDFPSIVQKDIILYFIGFRVEVVDVVYVKIVLFEVRTIRRSGHSQKGGACEDKV